MHQDCLTRSLHGGSEQHGLRLVTEQGKCDTETKSLCFSPCQAVLGLFVTHVRSNGHHVRWKRISRGLDESTVQGLGHVVC